MKNQIIQGDCVEELQKLPGKSVNMCMTSPPYWALRDYGVEGQLGLEPTFGEYINKLCDIFDEVKRVLRDDGTCWVNIGDTYGGSQGVGWKETLENTNRKIGGGENKSLKKELGIQSGIAKSLVMIPFRFAIEMVNRGWILRNTIIWHKPACMPFSGKDRFTVDFEYLFFLSKKKKYYFKTQYESSVDPESYSGRRKRKPPAMMEKDKIHYAKAGSFDKEGNDRNEGKKYPNRNKRTVWTINPKPFKEAHFAVYPEELCETPIKAGCPEGGVILDPFFGAGTTGLVALKQNKKFIGIELNEEYIEIAKARLKPLLEQQRL